MVTRDGGIPLVSHSYPGNRPDVTRFTTMIDLLVARHTALASARSTEPGDPPTVSTPPQATPPETIPSQVTVVFDAGQNSPATSHT